MDLQRLDDITKVAIRFTEDDQLRMRKVVRRSNMRCTGKFASWKMGRMLQWESTHELNAMWLLETCSWVKQYKEQPCIINYVLDDQQCVHYPDFLVITPDKKEFWEVKTEDHARRPDIARRTELLTTLLPRHGYNYRLMLAKHLASNIRLSNAKMLSGLGKIKVSPLQFQKIRVLFQEFETLPWIALQFDPDNPDLIRHVSRMILDGFLHLDITKPITDHTPVNWVFNHTIEGGASWESLISKKAQ